MAYISLHSTLLAHARSSLPPLHTSIPFQQPTPFQLFQPIKAVRYSMLLPSPYPISLPHCFPHCLFLLLYPPFHHPKSHTFPPLPAHHGRVLWCAMQLSPPFLLYCMLVASPPFIPPSLHSCPSYHNEIISVPLAPFTIFPTPLTSSHPTHLLPPHSPPPTPLTSSHPTHLLPPHSPPPIPLISSHPTHLLPPHSPPPIPLISSHPTHLLPPHSSPPTPLISSHRTHLLPPHSTSSTPLTSSHPNHLLPPHSSPPKPLTSSHPNHLLPPHSPPPTPLTSSNSAPSILPTLSNRQLLILSTLPCYAHHLTSSQMLSSVQCMNQLSPSTSGPPPLPAITLSYAPTPYQASSSTVVIASPGRILPSLPHHLH
ncbi:unnamed protein product [Closterium sp. NIES-65]|nr:unnamed protein product [Closterium sp. NIES-65]